LPRIHEQLREEGRLTFRDGRAVTATVDGPAERLDVVANALAPGDVAADLLSVLVPKDMAVLDGAAASAQSTIDVLLDRGRVLVEAVERLVCALYHVDPRLTDLVVESAVARAGTVAADDASD
jgi:hypothetical protein